jgi:hypothetical protein
MHMVRFVTLRFPAGQGEQTISFLDAAIWPLTHALHTGELSSSLYMPSLQASHDD